MAMSILLKFLTLKWNISRTIWCIEVGDGSFFFCIFHALSFELNFFFDQRFPLTAPSAFSNPITFLVPVIAACRQLLLKSISKLFEDVEWSNSLLRHFKIQTLLKINCCMVAISAFRVTQHSQIFSL